MSTKRFDNPFWFANVENRPHPWAGLTWMTPMIYVPDVHKAATFYEAAFGFVAIFENPDSSMIRIRYRGFNFTVNKEGQGKFPGVSPVTSKQAPPLTFYLYVDSVESTIQSALKSGAVLEEGPQEEPWGDKRARVIDPFGYVWDIASRLEKDQNK